MASGGVDPHCPVWPRGEKTLPGEDGSGVAGIRSTTTSWVGRQQPGQVVAGVNARSGGAPDYGQLSEIEAVKAAGDPLRHVTGADEQDAFPISVTDW